MRNSNGCLQYILLYIDEHKSYIHIHPSHILNPLASTMPLLQVSSVGLQLMLGMNIQQILVMTRIELLAHILRAEQSNQNCVPKNTSIISSTKVSSCGSSQP